jgi:hypothetical protein
MWGIVQPPYSTHCFLSFFLLLAMIHIELFSVAERSLALSYVPYRQSTSVGFWHSESSVFSLINECVRLGQPWVPVSFIFHNFLIIEYKCLIWSKLLPTGAMAHSGTSLVDRHSALPKLSQSYRPTWANLGDVVDPVSQKKKIPTNKQNNKNLWQIPCTFLYILLRHIQSWVDFFKGPFFYIASTCLTNNG